MQRVLFIAATVYVALGCGSGDEYNPIVPSQAAIGQTSPPVIQSSGAPSGNVVSSQPPAYSPPATSSAPTYDGGSSSQPVAPQPTGSSASTQVVNQPVGNGSMGNATPNSIEVQPTGTVIYRDHNGDK
jgi:hypothetical protein